MPFMFSKDGAHGADLRFVLDADYLNWLLVDQTERLKIKVKTLFGFANLLSLFDRFIYNLDELSILLLVLYWSLVSDI